MIEALRPYCIFAESPQMLTEGVNRIHPASIITEKVFANNDQERLAILSSPQMVCTGHRTISLAACHLW